MLVAMAGLPGTGKSTLARALVESLRDLGQGALILDKDHIRASLFTPGDVAYAREQDDLCVDIMLQVAGYLLRHDPNRIIVLDGRTFSQTYQVQRVVEAAAEMGTRLEFIECQCSEATALRRLARDQAGGAHPARNRGPDLYMRVAADAQPILPSHLTVDTEDALPDSIRACLICLDLGSPMWAGPSGPAAHT